MRYDADVIVVGAGPAGATAARGLAGLGVDTLIVERARLPRYKSCAGGVPVRTARILGFPIDAVIEDTVTGVTVTDRGRDAITRWSRAPLVHMVMRDRFDALLTDHARAAGARLTEGVTVRGVEREGDGFRLRTSSGALRCRYLVGADGVNSIAGRALGLGQGLGVGVALEAEVRAGVEAAACWRGRMNLDLGYHPWGYAWVFPKRRVLSIGLVLAPRAAGELRDELHRYLDRLGLANTPVERLVGHKILFRRGATPIAGGGALLLGDAAGLADELGAEGIYFAVRSGQLAATAIARASARGARELQGYERSVDCELMPELRAARLVARLFYPGLHRARRPMFLLGRHLPWGWRALFRVFRGESGYDAELARVPFGPRLAERVGWAVP